MIEKERRSQGDFNTLGKIHCLWLIAMFGAEAMKKSIKINALLNMVKQVTQIIFPIITIPYITRVLLPENYGKINTGNSLISYIALIAGLGIANYAIREGSLVRDDKEKLNSFSSQVFSINILSTVVSYIILAGIIFLVPHYQEYRLLLVIQGIAVIFTTIGADWINSIEEDYLYLTIRYIVLHIISLALMFLLVKKPEDYYIYAAITLVASVGANLINIFYIRRYVKIRFTLDIDWKKHLIPILILFGNSVAMTIYVSSDITMLEIFKGATEVGVYSVATKIYSIVKQILNAVLIVSIPRMTAYIGNGNKESFKKLGQKILSALITLMCPLMVGIIIFRTEAINLAGGKEYISGASSLLILTLAVAAALLATFFSGCVLMPLRKEKYMLKGTIISAIINVGLNFIFIPLLGGDGAAITTFVSEMFVSIYFGYLVKKEEYQFFNKNVMVLSFIGGLLVALSCVLIKNIFDSFLVYFGLSIVSSGILYGIVQIAGRNEVVMGLLPRPKK